MIKTFPKFALLLSLSASVSFGYVRLLTQLTSDPSPIALRRIDNTAIQFLVNDKIAAGMQAGGNTVISAGSDPQAAIRAALATWNGAASANIKFLPLKTTSAGISGKDSHGNYAPDNQNVIAVGASADELSAVGGAIAVTIDLYSPVDQTINGVNLPKGVVYDSDIIINPANVLNGAPVALSTDGSTALDLQSVMTHELGHALGANHSGILGASMFQFNARQRILTDDDLTFVNATYGKPGGGAALGTISGTVTVSGKPAPYALLTAVDVSSGVVVGGITNGSGSFSIQTPPGNYNVYAEPLNGVLAINIYLTSAQASAANTNKFQTTVYGDILHVDANSTATMNLAVTPGVSSIGTPYVAAAPAGGAVSYLAYGGPATLASGQAVDLVLAGVGFDANMNESNFTVYGAGISVRPGSVRVDPNLFITVNGARINVLRVTLDVAARSTPSLASLIVTKDGSTSSFSGALQIVPPTPTFTSSSVVSAGSFLGNGNGDGAVSPGGIYSLFALPNAPNLGPATFVQNGPFDSYGDLATTLGGVTVTFDGVPAPMFLSYGGQLNFQVPFEIAGRSSAKVVVTNNGSASAPVTVPVLPVQPAFFTFDGKSAVAFNLKDGTINSAQNPAARGDLVEVYGTGVGQVGYPVATGKGAPALPGGFTGNYTYSIGGSTAQNALFGGWVPGFVGFSQWDLQIPSNSATGAVSIKVTDAASGASSQPNAIIYVK